MSLTTVQEIEQAIGMLTEQETSELYEWLDQRPDPFEVRVAADLEAGRLDGAIAEALSDVANGRTRPL
jgi:hypothetical protein